jgi:hypothetical protein
MQYMKDQDEGDVTLKYLKAAAAVCMQKGVILQALGFSLWWLEAEKSQPAVKPN